MECLKLIAIAVLLYLIFSDQEGMRGGLAKGAYTSSAVDLNPERRNYSHIEDTNANPVLVECGPDKSGCRYIDAPRNFVRWTSQI